MGEMKVSDGATLRIGAEIFTRADGKPWASVSSPDQGSYDIPVRGVSEKAGVLELDFVFAAMQMRWAGDRFESTFLQGGRAMPLTMRKVTDFPARARTQTPKAPFPYEEHLLAIPSAPGVTLGATLTIPKAAPTGSVVVLVHGSGPQTRDVLMFGHRQFTVLADHLARRGIAVLRYDKRGIALSTGDYEKHTLPDLADDLTAVIKVLKARGQFARIGVVAHSEGPEVAARVAAADPLSVDFIVSMAGVGLNGLEAMLAQDRIYARDNGAAAADMDALMAYVRSFYQAVMAHSGAAQRETALKAIIAAQPPELKAMIKNYKMDQGTLSLAWAAKPFLRASLMSDAPAFWRKVRCPVLVLGGSLDHQVPAEENTAGIVAALRAGGNRQVESILLPSLNHAFQTARTGREDEYETIDETLAQVALDRIADFVRRQGR
jgi:pimeloyl-ACP methyl ester carboxylesterase